MGKYLKPKTSQDGLWYLGALIATKPKSLIRLLHAYGYPVPKGATDRILIQHTLRALKEQKRAFSLAIGRLLVGSEDHFTGKGGGSKSGGELPGITVGADPVSAVAGAVSSIANLVGFSQNQKQQDKQLRQQTLQHLLLRQQAPPPPTAPAATPNYTWLGVGVLVLVAGYFIMQRTPGAWVTRNPIPV